MKDILNNFDPELRLGAFSANPDDGPTLKLSTELKDGERLEVFSFSHGMQEVETASDKLLKLCPELNDKVDF
ncbi:hypothetical protein [Chromobacterium vaccinii]|uniref:hypothetical protein n=1 Tax=Chromobacterium vaccinii TaxID=1108595 RepID=UPI0011C05F4B|nr:hypothetical protein [Chromobacterium vaccinii]